MSAFTLGVGAGAGHERQEGVLCEQQCSDSFSAGVLTFFPTCQIFLPRLTAHARINIACFFLRRTTLFNVSELL